VNKETSKENEEEYREARLHGNERQNMLAKLEL
jgi:hypothetical protein